MTRNQRLDTSLIGLGGGTAEPNPETAVDTRAKIWIFRGARFVNF
ncbi:MAG: hypothetical protein ACO4AI_11075 [Prochlorothrix sp.]